MSTAANSIAQIDAKQEEHYVSRSLTQTALRRLRRDRLTLVAISILIIMSALTLLAPFISNQILGVDYSRTDSTITFLPPGAEGHILGTDDLGRDHLARLLYGGRVSLSIAFFGAVLSLVIGLTLGVVMGYFGGIVDDVVTWVITTITSIPSLFLLLIVSAVFLRQAPGSGAETLIVVLGLLGWTGTARLVRGETFSLREREYVLSARASGASDWRIMFSHIVPNLISIIVISLAIDIGALILVEAALSFLGLGVKPPEPTWGNMLQGAQDFFRTGPHLAVIPGIMIFMTVLCLYVIGDGIRDAFDPTTKD